MLAFAMVAIPAPAAAGETAIQSDPRATRVATVAYRLSLANAALCEAMLVPQSGLGFPDKDAVRVEASLDREPRDGALRLGVLGRDEEQEREFAAFKSCPAKVTLVQDEAVNAWADGTGIRLTTGLLARCRSDDDLALVLGHELAHNLLRHRQLLADRDIGASGLLPAERTTSEEFHETEEEADRFAVSLVMTAGYDLAGAMAFMDALLDRSIVDSETHPDPDRRLALLREAIARAQGKPGQQSSPVS